jgi:hypothetical protein
MERDDSFRLCAEALKVVRQLICLTVEVAVSILLIFVQEGDRIRCALNLSFK